MACVKPHPTTPRFLSESSLGCYTILIIPSQGSLIQENKFIANNVRMPKFIIKHECPYVVMLSKHFSMMLIKIYTLHNIDYVNHHKVPHLNMQIRIDKSHVSNN